MADIGPTEVIVGANVVFGSTALPRTQYVENAAKALLISSVAVDEQKYCTQLTTLEDIAAEFLFLTHAQLA
jgi:hypothetical protein